MKKCYFFILRIWEKSCKGFSQISFLEKIVFLFLCFLEPWYRCAFFISTKIKQWRGGLDHKISKPFRVISVGNLSVGGTGKSVVVSFLAKKLNYRLNDEWPSCAILSRGYGRKKKENVFFVDGMSRATVSDIGDEALMLARQTKVPVVVGRDRFMSMMMLIKYCRENDMSVQSIEHIIMDDSYQNHQLKKDCEILLLDARNPFGNGRCLPAGPLREKNFRRADIIIFTHADEVDEKNLYELKKNFEPQKIFTGRHAVVGVRSIESGDYVNALGGQGVLKKFLAVAGIGSFSGFLESVRRCGVSFVSKKFPDHYEYACDDVKKMYADMVDSGCDGIITTSKDWQKLQSLVGLYKNYFFVLEIDFEFLSKIEEEQFLKIVRG